MEQELITIKSKNSKFIMTVLSKNYEEALKDIKAKFNTESFYRNLIINLIEAPNLSSGEIEKIKEFINEKFSIFYREKTQEEESDKYNLVIEREKEKNRKLAKEKEDIEDIKELESRKLRTKKVQNAFENFKDDDYRTKIVKNNLRSGSSLKYDGNVIVIGDVNAGAEILATGNIIIFGILRGLASAGCKGDKEAFIVANSIKATQIRIGELIAIPPKQEVADYSYLQMAFIEDDKIKIQNLR